MPDLIDIAKFRAEARAGKSPAGGVFRMSVGSAKAVDEDRRAVRFCFSDGSVDRVGDTIDPNGWDTTQFMANPVALWAHNSWDLPIGRASNLAVELERLMGDIEFAPPEVYEFADTIYRMVKGGYLNAVSVGFQPIEYKFVENDPSRGWGIDFLRQELLEISVCPVPANANALAEARAKGIDTRPLMEWAEKLLDGGGKVILPRGEIERLRKAAKEPPTMAGKNPRARRRADGMSEDDPSAGGAVVGTCGRSADEECGMQDPEECSIHRTKDVSGDEEENKRIDRIVRRAVAAALKRYLPKTVKADDEPDGDEDPDHVQEVKAAHFHMKMMRAALDAADDHHDEAMKCLRRAMKAMDDNDGDEVGDPEEPPEPETREDDPETNPEDEEKAAAKRRVKQLLRAVN